MKNSSDWIGEASGYCDKLEQSIRKLLTQLDCVQTSVISGNTEQVLHDSDSLATLLRELAPVIGLRESLLRDFPAEKIRNGIHPRSLREALTQLGSQAAIDLRIRCDRIAREIRTVHQKANSLFLAEYTLAQTAGDILSLLTTGSPRFETYAERPNSVTTGRILDKAA